MRRNYESGPIIKSDSGLFYISERFAGVLLFAVLAVFHGVCGIEPVSVGVYKLVPDDVLSAKTRRQKLIDPIRCRLLISLGVNMRIIFSSVNPGTTISRVAL
jgi:hypothetical protein